MTMMIKWKKIEDEDKRHYNLAGKSSYKNDTKYNMPLLFLN